MEASASSALLSAPSHLVLWSFLVQCIQIHFILIHSSLPPSVSGDWSLLIRPGDVCEEGGDTALLSSEGFPQQLHTVHVQRRACVTSVLHQATEIYIVLMYYWNAAKEITLRYILMWKRDWQSWKERKKLVVFPLSFLPSLIPPACQSNHSN